MSAAYSMTVPVARGSNRMSSIAATFDPDPTSTTRRGRSKAVMW
jgi:hypothetical protein